MGLFKEFVNAGSFLNTDVQGFANQVLPFAGPKLATPSMTMPTKTVQGNIRRINYTQNPISIQLDDGTLWNLTKKQWDYLLATNKEPKINSNVQIEMYLDGTIKSINITQRNYKGNKIPDNSKENNNKSLLGGKTNKPEKTFGLPI